MTHVCVNEFVAAHANYIGVSVLANVINNNKWSFAVTTKRHTVCMPLSRLARFWYTQRALSTRNLTRFFYCFRIRYCWLTGCGWWRRSRCRTRLLLSVLALVRRLKAIYTVYWATVCNENLNIELYYHIIYSVEFFLLDPDWPCRFWCCFGDSIRSLLHIEVCMFQFCVCMYCCCTLPLPIRSNWIIKKFHTKHLSRVRVPILLNVFAFGVNSERSRFWWRVKRNFIRKCFKSWICKFAVTSRMWKFTQLTQFRFPLIRDQGRRRAREHLTSPKKKPKHQHSASHAHRQLLSWFANCFHFCCDLILRKWVQTEYVDERTYEIGKSIWRMRTRSKVLW